MRRIFLALAILLVIALIGGALYWYFVLSKQPPSDIAPGTTTKPTPGVGFGSLRPYATLCKEFQRVEGEITCEDALSIAKKKYSGTVQKISSGTFHKTEDGQSPGIGIWRIELKLTKPIIRNNNSFDKTRLFLRRDTGEEFRITRGSE